MYKNNTKLYPILNNIIIIDEQYQFRTSHLSHSTITYVTNFKTKYNRTL